MAKLVASERKLRGGYYTPRAIGEFITEWAIRNPTDRVLEPSCGDGELLRAAARLLIGRGGSPENVARQLFGIEIDPGEAGKARRSLAVLGLPRASIQVDCGDFFAFANEQLPERDLFTESFASISPERFDAVVGNPPFVRYQHFPEAQRGVAFKLMNQAGLHPTRLTNAWVPFVCLASMLLSPKGRLAMVVPAELLQVGYTADLRKFLSREFSRIRLITFRELVFPGIQQEVVLLCAEKGGEENGGITVLELDGVADLPRHRDEVVASSALKPMDHSTEKWTQYYLSMEEIGLVRRIREELKLPRLGELASVDVGVVTGLNEFFVLSESDRMRARLDGLTCPIVTRSGHLRGATFGKDDWDALKRANYPAHLLQIPAASAEALSAEVRAYIETGESQNYHAGYKCRIRKHWYSVPSAWIPDAFMLRQIHRHPKLTLNESGATCTDTIHRVRFFKKLDGRRVVAAALNSLTFAFSEILGRSYGGGVLELEPREAEQLPIPLACADRLDLAQLHELLRSDAVESLLDVTDPVLLKEGLSLSDNEVAILRGIWMKLRDRRLNRKHRSR